MEKERSRTLYFAMIIALLPILLTLSFFVIEDNKVNFNFLEGNWLTGAVVSDFGENISGSLGILGDATSTSCGDVNTSLTLTADVNNESKCFTILNNSLTLDCAGYTITFADGGAQVNDYAVSITGFDNITIKNCIILRGGGSTPNSLDPIKIVGTNNISIINNSINTYGNSNSDGIASSDSNFTIIVNNTINASGASGGNNGIEFWNSHHAIIQNNNITTGGTNSNSGIDLANNINVTIKDNIINSGGSSTVNYGIYIPNVINSTFFNNTINTYGTSDNEGIYMITSGSTWSTGNIIEENIIIANGTSSPNYGIWIKDLSTGRIDNNYLINNNISSLSGDFVILDEWWNGRDHNNTFILNNSFGQINWTSGNLTTNISVEIGNTIFLQNNLVGLTDSDQTLNLNSTAQIEIRGLAYSSTPQLLKDGVRCDDTDSCNISYVSNVLYANVSSFSNYTTQVATETNAPNVTTLLPAVNSIYNITNVIEIAANVTDEIAVSQVFANVTYPNGTINQLTLSNASTHDDKFNVSFTIPSLTGVYNITYIANDSSNNINSTETSNFTVKVGCASIYVDTTLDQNVSSTGTCFTINASDLTLDCAGYSVTYGTTSSTYNTAVNNTGGFDNITIKNCLIIKNGLVGSNNYGVYFSGSDDSTINNNTIFTNGTTNNYGVYASTSQNTTVSGNTINSSGSSFSNHAIYFISGTNGANITTNIINSFNGFAIDIEDFTAGFDNQISHNTIFANGTVAGNRGITLAAEPNDMGRNQIINNTISANGNANANYGIYLEDQVNTTIRDNTISTSGTTENYGVYIGASSRGDTIENNLITTTGTSTSHYGVYLIHTGGRAINNTNIVNNNITSVGATYTIFDLTRITDFNNLVYNNSFGQIYWNSTNLTTNITLGISNTIFIQNNLVGLTDNPQTLNLNSTAQIEIRNLAYSSTPQLLKDGVRCDNTDACNISYVNNILYANVSSFSNYTTQTATVSSNPATISSSSSGGTQIATSTKEAIEQVEGQFTKGIWDVLSPGESVSLKIDDESLGVTNIKLVMSREVSGGWLNVENVYSLPKTITQFPREVYKFVKISASPEISEESIQKAEIKFKVTKPWLINHEFSNNKISFYRFTNQWEELDTRISKEDDNYIYYTSETPGFSYFIIGENTYVEQNILRAELSKIEVIKEIKSNPLINIFNYIKNRLASSFLSSLKNTVGSAASMGKDFFNKASSKAAIAGKASFNKVSEVTSDVSSKAAIAGKASFKTIIKLGKDYSWIWLSFVSLILLLVIGYCSTPVFRKLHQANYEKIIIHKKELARQEAERLALERLKQREQEEHLSKLDYWKGKVKLELNEELRAVKIMLEKVEQEERVLKNKFMSLFKKKPQLPPAPKPKMVAAENFIPREFNLNEDLVQEELPLSPIKEISKENKKTKEKYPKKKQQKPTEKDSLHDELSYIEQELNRL
ncbi:MAG: PGF-pre-PGF domain-containing protein [Candidatus Woesearchaeota archaeon]